MRKSEIMMHQEEICKKYLNGESTIKIGKDFECQDSLIGKILKKNNIEIRKDRKFQKIEPGIIKEYLDGKSIMQISEELKCDRRTVRRILKENNVKKRTLSEAFHLKYKNEVRMPKELESMVLGNLLGDGHIRPVKVQTNFSLSSKHESYIDFAIKKFEQDGIKTKKYINKATGNFYLLTEATLQFAELRKKWYPNGKKIVPDDLELNASIISFWLKDDGSRAHEAIKFCTHGFTRKECEILAEKLSKFIGIENSAYAKDIENGKYTIIYVSTKYVNILLDKIGPSKVEVFNYKFVKHEKKERVFKVKFKDEKALEIIKKYELGKGAKELGIEYNCSSTAIFNTLRRYNIKTRSKSEARILMFKNMKVEG